MNDQIIQLEAYRLIRIAARDFDGPSDEILGAYVRGIVDLQTELYRVNEERKANEGEV